MPQCCGSTTGGTGVKSVGDLGGTEVEDGGEQLEVGTVVSEPRENISIGGESSGTEGGTGGLSSRTVSTRMGVAGVGTMELEVGGSDLIAEGDGAERLAPPRVAPQALGVGPSPVAECSVAAGGPTKNPS